jgi:phosphoribosylformimino-5-aminoimidazole carboxamide ribotide isomerase
MIVVPAIDLLEGKAVRLVNGVMELPIIYSDSPLDTAKEFLDAGATRLHLVDLDGAKLGSLVNFSLIEQIAKLDLTVELGGGIRNMEAAERVFDVGVDLALISTVAVKNEIFAKELASKYPGRIIMGIDIRSGYVATDGWYDTSKTKAADLLAKYINSPFESTIYTDIERDGTLMGPAVKDVKTFADVSPFKVFLSGGVSSIDDINAVRQLAHPNIAGVIVGKAIYEKKIKLEELF